MKYLYLLLVVAIVVCCFGCRGVYNSHESYLDDKLGNSFKLHTYWFEKTMCYWDCNKKDSARIASDSMKLYSEEWKKYYAIKYPDGNPPNKKEEEKKPDCNCN